jgi:hypothetical protein
VNGLSLGVDAALSGDTDMEETVSKLSTEGDLMGIDGPGTFTGRGSSDVEPDCMASDCISLVGDC